MKRLLLILLLLLVFGCKAAIEEEVREIIEEKIEEIEEEIEEPEVIEVVEPPSIHGTWEGTFIETQIASICTLENTGTVKLVFNVVGDKFTGTIVEQGYAELISGDSDCAGSYISVGDISGTVEGGETISATISIRARQIDADIPFTAIIKNDIMVGRYTGSGVEEGYSFVLEDGVFTVARTS